MSRPLLTCWPARLQARPPCWCVPLALCLLSRYCVQATCPRFVQPSWLAPGSKRAPWAAQVTYPLDLVRTRLAYDVEGRAPPATASPATAGARIARATARRGIVGVLAETVRAEGVLGLYRGIGPTMLGILPYAGLKFYVYQSLKAEYRRCAGVPPAH